MLPSSFEQITSHIGELKPSKEDYENDLYDTLSGFVLKDIDKGEEFAPRSNNKKVKK